MKTIDDVTKGDVIQLVEAAIDLLGSAMMMHWVAGGDDEDDTSHSDSINSMREALERVGLPQITIEEFGVSIEAILKSEIPPEMHNG